MGAKYTIELRTIHNSNNMGVFDFDYNFYDDNVRKEFEDQFIDYYYFHEIGFETIGRFKHMLRTRLNIKNHYYKQLYETELKAKEINFLLNKDLTETFTKETVRESEQEVNSQTDVNANNNSVTENKESNINNGNASLSYDDLTSINKDTTKLDSNSNTFSNNVAHVNDREVETLTNISKGNIGVTSSAELLEKWRSVIININEIIINDCADLFMQVY